MPITSEEAAAAFAPLLRERSVLLAVSGGPDSMALMGLVARWCNTTPGAPDVIVATVNHGLRPEAADECRLVVAEAQRLCLQAVTLVCSTLLPGAGLPEAARAARYEALEDAALRHDAGAIVTAHHADDQAETVLSRLLHGSGPAGLAGMREVRALEQGSRLIRPCLGWPKARLVATAQALGLPCVSDPSNVDPKFERARLRSGMARFEALGLTRARLALLAARAARADDALAALAASAGDRHRRRSGQGFEPGLFGETEEVVIRVIQAALGGATRTRLERLERLVGELRAAFAEGRALRRSAAGHVVELDRSGVLRFRREPERRRGRP
ncbi:MAG: tRNA lysidine(34) synthetase TilS [Alsobacter sp.]